jgi:putative methionine-R-sulfoxide reductase with GAF domain
MFTSTRDISVSPPHRSEDWNALIGTAREACDGLTNSEIVVPLMNKAGRVVGVLDLDSTLKGTFTDEDRIGLERIVKHLAI